MTCVSRSLDLKDRQQGTIAQPPVAQDAVWRPKRPLDLDAKRDKERSSLTIDTLLS